MNKLSGNKNVDMLILMNLNDNELSKVCSVNKYINIICEDKHFWNTRIRMLLNVNENELHDLRRYLNLDGKELYVYFVSRERTGWKYTKLLIQFLLKYRDFIDEIIQSVISKNLPKYINKEEFIYYLRGTIPKQILEYRIINVYYPYPDTNFFGYTLGEKLPKIIGEEIIPFPDGMTTFMDKYIKENIRKQG